MASGKKRATKQSGSFDRVKGRKTALSALNALRRVRGELASDPRVSPVLVDHFTHQVEALEASIGYVLPEWTSEVKLDLEDLEEKEATTR